MPNFDDDTEVGFFELGMELRTDFRGTSLVPTTRKSVDLIREINVDYATKDKLYSKNYFKYVKRKIHLQSITRGENLALVSE